MLFTAFRAAFATLGDVLHIPLTLMLVGIVLRGSAFVFRSYGRAMRTTSSDGGDGVFVDREHRDAAVLGIVIGAISSGAVGQASARAARGLVVHRGLRRAMAGRLPADGRVLRVGVVRAARRRILALAGRRRSRDRHRAPRAAVTGLAWSLAPVDVSAPASRARHPLTVGGSGRTPLPRLRSPDRRALVACYPLAAGRVGARLTLDLWGWALAQYPFVIPPALTIRQSAAPTERWRLLSGSGRER